MTELAPEFTLAGLRVVERVAALGSFTAAGAELGYTQSAVSRQIAAIEAAAGAPLFQREARGVRPTAAGEVAVRHAAGVLRAVAAARAELEGLGDRVAGRIVAGAYPTALVALVPEAIAALRRAHPAASVALREGGSPTQLRRLRAGRLDVAVIADGPGFDYDLSGLAADPLTEGRIDVAVAAGHRLAERGEATLAELAGEPWIAGAGAAGDPQFAAWPGLEAAEVAFTVRDWPARLGLVAAGLGVALVPSGMIGALPAAVVAVPVRDAPHPRRTVLAVTAPERSPLVAAFVDALRSAGSATVE